VESCQLGVFAAYVSGKGRAFVDRELYMPETWMNDPDRRAEAGVAKRACTPHVWFSCFDLPVS